jgi:MFS family permease
MIGTTVEWYDFFLYGTAAALVFNQLFFPSYEPLTGTLLAFGTYAVGFFARPVGGIVAGHYGDKIGRKAMLVLTLLIMGIATFAIGLCRPTKASGSGRRSCSSRCAFSRASVSGENGAARC